MSATPTIDLAEYLLATKFLRAYLECSDAVQAGIREMLDVIADPETDNDDRHMALVTLADALFPNPHKGQLGMDLEESECEAADAYPELKSIVSEMDKEEATFAERLSDIMQKRNMTQAELAEKIGVGQPAISNMLNRQCRPQRRTILRLATALGVGPDELWPRP